MADDLRAKIAPTCGTCGGCRIASLTWLGGDRWRPNPCPDCQPASAITDDALTQPSTEEKP